jgi:hypothetical protein
MDDAIANHDFWDVAIWVRDELRKDQLRSDRLQEQNDRIRQTFGR